MVDVIVRFNRCLYAQLRAQEIDPPHSYSPFPPASSPEHLAARLGMMLTCGFEMLAAAQPQATNQAEPGRSSETQEPADWKAFVASLQRVGYFGDEIQGELHLSANSTDITAVRETRGASNVPRHGCNATI